MKHLEFKKPKIKELKKKGYTLVDMHSHTRASFDATPPIWRVLLKARWKGIGVAITDHDKIKNAVKAYKNSRGVFVIPGIEVTSKCNRHFLFYFKDDIDLTHFYEHYIKGNIKKNTVEDLIELSKKYDCLFVMAHPFGYYPWHNNWPKGKIYKKLMKALDAVEVYNSSVSKKNIMKSYALAKKEKLGYTGGSDAHTLFELGKGITIAKINGNGIESFFRAVRKRETYAMGRRYSWYLHRVIILPILYLMRKLTKL